MAHSVANYLTSRDYFTWSWEGKSDKGMYVPTAVLLLKLNAFEVP